MNDTIALEVDLLSLSQNAMRWLLEDAFPFWSRNGVDTIAGGFHDLLDMKTGLCVSYEKRSFVQARQIYVFAEASRLGWHGPWQDMLENGLRALEDLYRHEEWGYLNSLGYNNTRHHIKRDLYDQVFIAFAKSSAADAMRINAAFFNCQIAGARKLLANIEANWSAPSGGLYEGELRPKLPRRQNPHMHLLEAHIALAIATGEQQDIDNANKIAYFAIDRLLNNEYGIVPEFFTDDWTAVTSDGRLIVEPGHQFEWVWLFCRLAKLGGADYRLLAKKLWHFTCRYGIDKKRGVALDAIGHDGSVVSSSARLWPQTERLKAALAMMEYGVADADMEVSQSIAALHHYLQTPTRGLFYDTLLEDSSFVDEPVRASSMYHIVCAFSELRRIGDAGLYPSHGV